MCAGMNYAFRDLKEMVTVDRERIRRMRTNYVVSEAIEKGKDLATIPNLYAKDFYINLGLKKIDLPK